MASPYTSPTLVGFNSSPPSDDGSTVAANQVTWAKHKTKLADPLRTYIDEINTNVQAAFTSIYGQTDAETTEIVTPTSYQYEQGRRPRYGAIGTLSAANWRNLHAQLGRPLWIQDVDEDAGLTGSASVDTAAINAAADQLGHIGTIYLPQTNLGYFINPNAITFEGPIRLVGDGRGLGATMLTANGFATGQFMFKWDTGTASAITNAGMKGFYCKTTNTFGSVMNLEDCNESEFEDIRCEGLQDFCKATLGYSNTFRNIKTRNHTRYSFHFLDAANDILLQGCILDGVSAGAYGVYVVGGNAFGANGITVFRSRFEGFTDVNSHPIVLAPATGEVLYHFAVRDSYFEACVAEEILSTPVDAAGVRRLIVEGNSFVAGGSNPNPVVLLKTHGASIRLNRATGYATALLASQGSNTSVKIEENTLTAGMTPYSVTSGSDSGVRVRNNIDTTGANADNNQTLTGAGAVSLFCERTYLVTTGVNALTLADGVEGQEKFIVMKTYAGDGTLTPTNLYNGTTITFDGVGDSAHLVFLDGQWCMYGGTATLA